MFVLKNAWFTIRRHAARSLVMVLVCLVVAALATTAATVLQADTKARTTDYESQQVDAVISPRKGTKVSPLAGTSIPSTPNACRWMACSTRPTSMRPPTSTRRD